LDRTNFTVHVGPDGSTFKILQVWINPATKDIHPRMLTVVLGSSSVFWAIFEAVYPLTHLFPLSCAAFTASETSLKHSIGAKRKQLLKADLA
jgi:hypothetical protein